jgi:putative GTP pyrophosphokinase
MSANPKQYQDFLRYYEGWVINVLTPAQLKLKEILQEWRKPEYWKDESDDGRQPAPSPVHRAYCRIKRPESAADKILRKPESFPDGLSLSSIRKMPDAFGCRIVTFFLSGLPIVDNALRNHPQIEFCEEDPPIAYLDDRLLRILGLGHLRTAHKESGYSSIHYVVRFKDGVLGQAENPLIEIQLRTLTSEIWGEIEHVLGYKPHKRTSFAVQKQFQIISSQLTSIDEHFNFLYEEQRRYRNEIEIGDDDPLNAENLPAIIGSFELTCAQREIDGLLKVLASRQIKTVKDLVRSASREKIEIIRNTYLSHERRHPIDFEVIANIAATATITDHNEIQRMVEAQIDFLNTWANLKKRSS